MKYNHIENKSTFLEQLKEGTINDNDISLIEDTNEVYTHGRYYKRYEWGELFKSSKIIIDQSYSDGGNQVHITGDINGDAIRKIAENTHLYACKYLGEKEGMVICQLDDEDNTKYYNGEAFNQNGSEGGMYAKLPLFSVKSEEIEPDVFELTFGYNMGGFDNVWEGNQLIGYTFARRSAAGIEESCEFSADPNNWKRSLQEAISIIKNRGDSFSLFSYSQRCILSFLYYAIYGTTKDVIGGTGSHSFLGLNSFCSDWQEKLNNVIINNRVASITMPDGTQRTLNIAGSGSLGILSVL